MERDANRRRFCVVGRTGRQIVPERAMGATNQIMKLTELFTDDEAVSPVIGVILMVAITVILAAVIGTFVLGLGNQVQDSSPQANFAMDFSVNATHKFANITHDGGDGIDYNTLSVNIGGNTIFTDGAAASGYLAPVNQWNTGKVTAGKEVDLMNNTSDWNSGDEVRVIWQATGSDKTATLAKRTWKI